MNTKIKGFLSGAIISALVAGSAAFADDHAAPAAGDKKEMSGNKDGCNSGNGCHAKDEKGEHKKMGMHKKGMHKAKKDAAAPADEKAAPDAAAPASH